MPLRKVLFGLLAAMCVVWFYAQAVRSSGHDVAGDVPAAPAPEIAIHTGAGDVSLTDQRGKVVLLDFWATWCGPCRMSIPAVERLYAKHQAGGFQVVGVSMDREASAIPPFAKEMKITYPVGLPSSMAAVRKYLTGGIPLMVLVDRKGMMRWVQEGYGDGVEEELAKRIEQLLAEPA